MPIPRYPEERACGHRPAPPHGVKFKSTGAPERAAGVGGDVDNSSTALRPSLVLYARSSVIFVCIHLFGYGLNRRRGGGGVSYRSEQSKRALAALSASLRPV